VWTVDGTAPLSGRGPRETVSVRVGAATRTRTSSPSPSFPVELPAAGPAGPAVSAHADFDALADAWDDLWARCPAATPFQTHAWLRAWARAYVAPGRLAVVTVRESGRLVAAAAMHRVRRGPVVVLEPLGGEISDHTDVLLDPSVPDAGRRLTQELLRLRGWQVLALPEALPASAAAQWSAGWPGRVRRLPASVNLQLPALPTAEALTRLPARTASTLRRKLRKIDQLGVEHAEVPARDVPQAVDGLLALHAAQWAGRRGNPEHLTDRYRDHLAGALVPMVERGQAVVVEYRLDGELVAAEVDLVGHDQLAYYLAGISPALRSRIDTAVLLVSRALDLAARLGKGEYSFLRGEEDYKSRWRPDVVTATRLLLIRPGLLGSRGYVPATRAWRATYAAAQRSLRGPIGDLARRVVQGVRVLRARG
jgi:CelD/BcsL family acetyltransferase involved in cellulose biosynthesis